MITFILLAFLGLLLAVVLVAMFRTSGANKQVAAATQARAVAATTAALQGDAWDAHIGDVVSVSAAAEDFSDLDFPVDRRSAYQTNSGRWIDLSGEFRGRRVYLEVHRHPSPLLMGLFDPRKLTIADIGLSEQQLTDFDARQDPTASIQFANKSWHYQSSREIGYFENESGAGEGLYRWLFEEQGGARLICVEKWEGEPFDVRVAVILKHEDVTVYRKS